MNETYLGWDGKSYPWPPPEGWYLASDGRYWAPDTGPNPPPAGAAAPPAPAATPAEASARLTAQISSDQLHSAGGLAQGQPADSYAGSQPAGFNPTSPLGVQAANDGWVKPVTAPPDQGGGAGRIALGILAFVAIAAIAGAGFLFLRSGSNDDATATDAAAEEGSVDEAGDETPASSIPASTSTADQSTPEDPSAATEAPATTEAPTTTVETTTTISEAQVEAQIAEFRAILLQNELNSEGLSDDQIEQFGSTFCIFAASSADEAEFAQFREEAIDEANSEVDTDGLELVIDTAVVVFCPDQAERLDIRL